MFAVSPLTAGRTASDLASMDCQSPRPSENVAEPLARVLAGCRQGPREAQRELVMQTHDRVYRTVFRLVGRDDADDVTQQVYVQHRLFAGGTFGAIILKRISLACQSSLPIGQQLVLDLDSGRLTAEHPLPVEEFQCRMAPAPQELAGARTVRKNLPCDGVRNRALQASNLVS